MKRIRIFLASSIVDLKFDRIEIGNFFRQLNDIYIESGVYFDLVMCEDYDNGISLEGKQSEFDKLLCDSDLVFFLFFSKVGEYTKHEFDIALESYKTKQKPKIVTYFKCVDEADMVAEDVKSFMNMLDTELRHYYNVYREIDTLKLGIFMQIKLMRLDSTELAIENGKLMYGKTQIAETKNIPMFGANDKLNRVRREYEEAEEKLRVAKIAFFENGTDEAYLSFSEAASKKEEAEKALRDLEIAILAVAEKMYEVTSNGSKISDKQKAAYRYMERGEWELALTILDKDDILAELSHNEKLGDAMQERIAINSREILQRIDVLRAAGLEKGGIDEVLSLYETVYNITIKHNLELKPLLEYAKFLHELNHDEDALRISEKLSYFYSDPDRDVGIDARAELFLERGKICVGLKRYDESIENLKKGVGLADEIYSENDARIACLCADLRNILANALYFKDKFDEAFQNYEQAMKYYEIAYALDPKYKSKVAMIYDNFGNILERYERLSEALDYHLKAEKLYFELSQEDEKYKKSLSRCYHNTGLCYDKLKNCDMAEKYLLFSIKLREEIRQNNPASIEPVLSGSYLSLGLLYKENNKGADKAIEALTASKKIRILLRKRSAVYASELRSVFWSFIYDRDNVMSVEQRNDHCLEYINLLLSLQNTTDFERQELCETISYFLYGNFNKANYELIFSLLKTCIDLYVNEGNEEWHFDKKTVLRMMSISAEYLGKNLEYLEYKIKLDAKN